MIDVMRCDAGEEANMMMVAGVSDDPCVLGAGKNLFECAASCFRPGKCNECCKGLAPGFVRGKCDALACYCCTTPEPEDKPAITS